MESVYKFADAVKNSKNIVIISHVGPDGDTLGSMLALQNMITQINGSKRVDAIITGKIPDIYKFLPGIDKVRTSDSSDLYQSYDLAIAVDCASFDRLGDAQALFRNAKKTVNIDHHISNIKFADINVVEPEASASGQILYGLIAALGVKLNRDIAENLYVAILTDTGGFKFDNTKPETFEVAAELLKTGIDPGYIFKKCYESKPIAMVKLQARAIDQAIFTDNNKIVYTLVSRKLLADLNATDDYIDGISEALRQIDSVEVSMVFKETVKGDTRVSFRSNWADVCQIARFFGGGGHKLAAGCTIQKSLEDSVNEVLPIVRKQINK